MNFSQEWQSLNDEEQQILQNNQTEFPIKIGAIAKDLGITVKKATLKAGISGEIEKINDNNYVIRVNRHDTKERQRFTLAHEIAHFLLHKEQIGEGIEDNTLYRSKLSNDLEIQANKLAADIIMPWHLIKNTLERYQGLEKKARWEQLSKDAQISLVAIKIRLGIKD